MGWSTMKVDVVEPFWDTVTKASATTSLLSTAARVFSNRSCSKPVSKKFGAGRSPANPPRTPVPEIRGSTLGACYPSFGFGCKSFSIRRNRLSHTVSDSGPSWHSDPPSHAPWIVLGPTDRKRGLFLGCARQRLLHLPAGLWDHLAGEHVTNRAVEPLMDRVR